MDVPEPVLLTVDDETFRARADPDQPGARHLDWVSGPNDGVESTGVVYDGPVLSVAS
ncbi:hypothetical protein [Nocardioides sp. B-3]|uniref:hypothetical protein n=1 Tax=Nocardioides sp. B-3 TaxID=2895565 RepID=UPI0021536D64|nr:hypothetical protein [Nocardioides sp. B-3]UUZ59884.1 hypothetical protein LP418_02210 [Nocardioides sp. B-3]